MSGNSPLMADGLLLSEIELLVEICVRSTQLLELYQEIEGAMTKHKYGGAVPQFATMLGDRLHEHMSLENPETLYENKARTRQGTAGAAPVDPWPSAGDAYHRAAAIEFVRQLENNTVNDSNSVRSSTSLRSVGETLVRRIRQ